MKPLNKTCIKTKTWLVINNITKATERILKSQDKVQSWLGEVKKSSRKMAASLSYIPEPHEQVWNAMRCDAKRLDSIQFDGSTETGGMMQMRCDYEYRKLTNTTLSINLISSLYARCSLVLQRDLLPSVIIIIGALFLPNLYFSFPPFTLVWRTTIIF